MFNKTGGMPLYIQLINMLRKQIESGQLTPHMKLPSERELCKKYNISRVTIRRAFAELIHEGLIYTSIGKGVYVAEKKLERKLQPLVSFTADMRRRGMSVSSKIIETAIIHADNSLATRLNLLPETEVVKLHRLRIVEGIPIAIQHSYLPHYLCPGILKYDFSSLSLLDILRNEYNLKLVRAESEIEAALANSEESSLLQLPKISAILIVDQTTYLENKAIIEFVHSVFPGGKYKLFIPNSH